MYIVCGLLSKILCKRLRKLCFLFEFIYAKVEETRNDQNSLLFGETCLVAFCEKNQCLWFTFSQKEFCITRTKTKIGTFIYNLSKTPKITSAGSVN